MPYTHDYKFEIGDSVYKGQIEITPSGVMGFKADDPLEGMAGHLETAAKEIFNLAGGLQALGEVKLIRIIKKV